MPDASAFGRKVSLFGMPDASAFVRQVLYSDAGVFL